jgi:hypothetical protein
MDRREARKKYLEYLKAVREKKADDLSQVEKKNLIDMKTLKDTYRSLSLGNLILDIHDAFRKAGTNHLGQPRLAIARAHLRWVRFHREERRSYFESVEKQNSSLWTAKTRNRITIPTEFVPGTVIHRMSALTAMVPTVPAEFMPKTGLANLHILFEPEWRAVAPQDPILLKSLGGPMYVVLAQWDLTSVERAVLFDSRIYD